MSEKRIALGVQDELAELEGLSPAALVILGEAEIKTLDDLGDLAGDELIEILGTVAPNLDNANAIIMAARAHWFNDEPADSDGEEDEAAEPLAASATEDDSAVQGKKTGTP